jgi:hypothetical protein
LQLSPSTFTETSPLLGCAVMSLFALANESIGTLFALANESIGHSVEPWQNQPANKNLVPADNAGTSIDRENSKGQA